MSNNELRNILKENLNNKTLKISDIDEVHNYLFIVFDNEQKILTNGQDLFDVSDFDHLYSQKFCAVISKNILCALLI